MSEHLTELNYLNTSDKNPIPQRVKSFKHIQQQGVLLKPLSFIIKKQVIPNSSRYQQLGDGLWQGDPSMDVLVEWLFSENPAQRKKIFEQALQHGISSIEDCPIEIQHFFKQIETYPAWLDQKKMEQALDFIAATGIHANYILRDVALMGGYLLSGLNQALVLTGALNKGASRRLAETSKWWIDCTTKNGLRRDGAGFKSTIHVRMIHSLVRRNLKKRQEWNASAWGLPINQIDMAATNLAFCNLFLLGLRGIGIFPNRQEADAVMHFWKYLGWLMGVEEKWLAEHEVDGMILMYQFIQTQPSADWTSKALGYSLSQEPFEKEYQRFIKLRQQLDYHKHLSISRYFLGSKKMELLGLPKHIIPWYPVLLTPKNIATFRLQRFIPILREKQIQRGRQEQLDYLAGFGSKGTQVIQPAKDHPAYIAN
ncbi:DUF2236 domain-containing protein [Acinetobacter guerrae]|uniref:DUF2236 domain-containing protein n=1 Tax=Acinetobacter guerrae TaxID=1843371 RepID=A0A3A8F305_9GAMM|nr:oxygenase MpaB family protein [Acinetobacter guerrae]RKG35093.1 DUF2236 domain-containing protein [Acinetobacter guerrae]